MQQFVSNNDVCAGAKHQINGSFVTKDGEEHLNIIIPMNLLDDQYALERFLDVIDDKDEMNIGQYYLELISNLGKPGKNLYTTKFLSLESYCHIINCILVCSYNFVKENYKW